MHDAIPWKKTNAGNISYRSASLESLWTLGLCDVTPFSRKAAGYVARYSMKKLNGDFGKNHYERIHPLTGEVCQVEPEFGLMSSRPGIGGRWFDEYERDCFPHDNMVVDGKKVKIPRYFSNRLKDRFTSDGSNENALVPKDDLSPFKLQRKQFARKNADNSTPERLAVREESLTRKVDRLQRDL